MNRPMDVGEIASKPITFSHHALAQLADRGTTREEIITTIREGECQLAKNNRLSFRKNFLFEKEWKGRYYQSKQVMPIVAEEQHRVVVITVYVFYFGEKR